MSYIPPIDSVAVAASLPASVQRFHGKVLPRITVVSTEEAYQSIMAKYAAASEHAAVFGTHSGKFHTDEALGLAIRCMMEQADVPIVIVRSRAPAMLAHCDQLFDVGHVYDPARGLFDHHQKEFNGYFDKPDEEKTIMATAGLVFKEWGKRLIASLYPTMMRNEDLLTELYMAMYTDFVEAVDASDNGFSITPRGVRPRYRVTTAIQSQVGDLKPALGPRRRRGRRRNNAEPAICARHVGHHAALPRHAGQESAEDQAGRSNRQLRAPQVHGAKGPDPSFWRQPAPGSRCCSVWKRTRTLTRRRARFCASHPATAAPSCS